MSENDPSAVENAEAAASAEDNSTPVRRGGLIIVLLILVSIVWYLFADRFTPFTSQARVQGYVIGVAPRSPVS